MSNQLHPLAPPDELLEHWRVVGNLGNWQNALTLAYRAGADQELEACAEWVGTWCASRYLGAAISADVLRAARRPSPPPSLKEQALADLDSLVSDLNNLGMGFKVANIIRALEALPND